MNLIHIADTHLGLAAFNRLDPESGMNLREKQVYKNFLSEILVIIQRNPNTLELFQDLEAVGECEITIKDLGICIILLFNFLDGFLNFIISWIFLRITKICP